MNPPSWIVTMIEISFKFVWSRRHTPILFWLTCNPKSSIWFCTDRPTMSHSIRLFKMQNPKTCKADYPTSDSYTQSLASWLYTNLFSRRTVQSCTVKFADTVTEYKHHSSLSFIYDGLSSSQPAPPAAAAGSSTTQCKLAFTELFDHAPLRLIPNVGVVPLPQQPIR